MTNPLYHQIFFSIVGGSSATILYLFISHFLDYYTTHNISTAISYSIAIIIGFIIKSYGFLYKIGSLQKYLPKYIIADLLIFIVTYYSVSYLIHNKQQFKLPMQIKKYYNTLIRMLVAIAIFFILSFPLQKFWVFT